MFFFVSIETAVPESRPVVVAELLSDAVVDGKFYLRVVRYRIIHLDLTN